MAMASKAIANSTIVLRIFTLAALAASVVVLVTNTVTAGDIKLTFKDITAYRYVLATAAIGALYTLIQLPFALYYASTNKRMIKNKFLSEFDFYADKIISFLLATGVGAGFAVTCEFKRLLNDLEDGDPDVSKFLDRANIAAGLLFLGFICMVALSILSSINRTSSKS